MPPKRSPTASKPPPAPTPGLSRGFAAPADSIHDAWFVTALTAMLDGTNDLSIRLGATSLTVTAPVVRAVLAPFCTASNTTLGAAPSAADATFAGQGFAASAGKSALVPAPAPAAATASVSPHANSVLLARNTPRNPNSTAAGPATASTTAPTPAASAPTASASAALATGAFDCSKCAVGFPTALAFRAHIKSPGHALNVKRHAARQPPLSAPAAARAAAEPGFAAWAVERETAGLPVDCDAYDAGVDATQPFNPVDDDASAEADSAAADSAGAAVRESSRSRSRSRSDSRTRQQAQLQQLSIVSADADVDDESKAFMFQSRSNDNDDNDDDDDFDDDDENGNDDDDEDDDGSGRASRRKSKNKKKQSKKEQRRAAALSRDQVRHR